jgi:D-serine deaminase-like pyridoxal phosphate-dependent protein
VAAHTREVGLHRQELDTPALLLDLRAMEHNLHAMAAYFEHVVPALRPHVKLHRATPALAHRQLKAGAIGLTCAKLSEAEALAASGVSDILIANQIVGPHKIRRLMDLATHTRVMVAVDSAANIRELSAAALARGVELGVLVEVNIGHNRCGVAPLEPALALSRQVAAAPGLVYMGLMGYDGHCTFGVTEAQRREMSRQANTLLADTRRLIEQAGLAVPIVSAGGTFTYRHAARIEGITEIQAGTYLLMDTACRESDLSEFECVLSVLTMVTSRPSWPGAERLAIVDVGSKGISTLLGPPEVKDPAGARIIRLSQEHARVDLSGLDRDPQVGDKIELWVRDANGTVNLYDRFHAMRDDVVEAVWEIPNLGIRT